MRKMLKNVVLKNIRFLFKQQMYIIMLLASSFAFANQKAGVCQSSFSSQENNVSKESKSTDRASSASFVEKNTNTKKEAFPPLYKASDLFNEMSWKPVQQDPITKNKVQESFWELIYESLGKDYKNDFSDGIKDDLQWLIRNGADIYAKDERGWTALDYAVKSENSYLVTALTGISFQSVRGGYRSFMKSVFGFFSNSEGYSASDYKRALRIAKKNMQTAIDNRPEEPFTQAFHNGRTIELSRFKSHEKEKVNELIINTLERYLSQERIARAGQTLLVSLSGFYTYMMYLVYSIIF